MVTAGLDATFAEVQAHLLGVFPRETIDNACGDMN